jgi:hypothetical protein
MKSHRLLPLLLIAAFCLAAGVREANALILVYKVTSTARSLNFPKTNSVTFTGYLFFDTNDASQSLTIELFRNKTYTQNRGLFSLLTPANFNLNATDRNSDGVNDVVAPLIGVSGNGFIDARAMVGAVPRGGFKIGANPNAFTNVAKVLHGYGSRVVFGSDLFTRTDVLVIDALTGANPNTTTVARDAIVSRLATAGYHPAP